MPSLARLVFAEFHVMFFCSHEWTNGMPSLGIVFSVTFRIVLLRALNLAHFSDYFVRQPYIFWRELLRQQRESTTAFCSRRQQAEGLVVASLNSGKQPVIFSSLDFASAHITKDDVFVLASAMCECWNFDWHTDIEVWSGLQRSTSWNIDHRFLGT